MSNEAIAAVGVRVIDTIEKSGSEEVKQSALFAQLKDVNMRYQSSVEPNGSKLLTDAIEAKYKERETLYIDFYELAFGLQKSRIVAVKEAATVVFKILNMYGKSFKGEKKSDQTVRYLRIIETLKETENAEPIATINATELLAELNVAQTMYEDLYLGRGNRLSLKTPSKEIRKEMNEAVKDIVEEIVLNAKKYPKEANISLMKNIEQRFNEVYIPAPGSKKEEPVVQNEKMIAGSSEAS